MNKKKLLSQNFIVACMSLFILFLTSCSNSEKMDEDAVREYLNSSPALTLYSTCDFDEEQPDLKEDFLGKTRYSYEYKAFNYIVDHFEDFYMNESLVQGTVYLAPANLTKAGQRYNELNENTIYKEQEIKLFECFFRFNRFVSSRFGNDFFVQCSVGRFPEFFLFPQGLILAQRVPAVR